MNPYANYYFFFFFWHRVSLNILSLSLLAEKKYFALTLTVFCCKIYTKITLFLYYLLFVGKDEMLGNVLFFLVFVLKLLMLSAVKVVCSFFLLHLKVKSLHLCPLLMLIIFSGM